eukprot:588218-Pleurochrysis_carterae.AAC.1
MASANSHEGPQAAHYPTLDLLSRERRCCSVWPTRCKACVCQNVDTGFHSQLSRVSEQHTRA